MNETTNPDGDRQMTQWSRADGTRVMIWHSKPIEEALGADLLASIRWWAEGRVKYAQDGAGE
jgi:hypothetical protein